MFEIPSNPHIVKCTVTKETVDSKAEPELIIDENTKREAVKHRKPISKSTKTNEETA